MYPLELNCCSIFNCSTKQKISPLHVIFHIYFISTVKPKHTSQMIKRKHVQLKQQYFQTSIGSLNSKYCSLMHSSSRRMHILTSQVYFHSLLLSLHYLRHTSGVSVVESLIKVAGKPVFTTGFSLHFVVEIYQN